MVPTTKAKIKLFTTICLFLMQNEAQNKNVPNPYLPFNVRNINNICSRRLNPTSGGKTDYLIRRKPLEESPN